MLREPLIELHDKKDYSVQQLREVLAKDGIKLSTEVGGASAVDSIATWTIATRALPLRLFLFFAVAIVSDRCRRKSPPLNKLAPMR